MSWPARFTAATRFTRTFRQAAGAALRTALAIAAITTGTATGVSAQQSSLTFNGTSQYVTFGQALNLSASNFTVETWFMRTGAGTVTSTGAGGSSVLGLTNVVPLVTKGRGEGDGGTIDCNYFLGIQNTPSVVLCGDYEHDATSNNNHAIVGTTILQNNVWYHAALTYDGATIKLYLNGNLEAQAAATPAPRSDLAQHAAIASALNSTGAAAGFFAGVLDEARVWNVARTQAQIQAAMGTEVTSGTGLLGRWGLNEGTGTTAANSVVTGPNGTLTAAPVWTAATVFAAPAAPGAAVAGAPTASQVHVTWTDNSSNELTFEIERSTTGPAGTFSALATVGQGVVAYDDNTVTAGTEYCYRVRAVNNGGASAYDTPACATPLAPAPPADPTGLTATVISNTQVNLAWTDNATTETAYEVERSDSGPGGPFTLVATLGAGATSWPATGLTPGTAYCWQVRATNANGGSGYAGPACATTAATAALDLGSGGAYVTFGNPAALKLSQFTIEMWMRRDGAGTGANTGSGGIADAIPLVAKGMADGEVSSKDVNYLFGIKAATNVLCADFEEDTTGASKSLNHPILGVTPIPADGAWRHVAVTYDGTWKLYLNGVLDAQLAVNQPPAFSSDVAVALGRALILAGTPSGNFDGAMDEVRIWNVARTASQLLANANVQITSATPGLVARWALDEGTGTAIGGSAGTSITGTLTGTGASWTLPATFDVPLPSPPSAPGSLVATAPTTTQVHLAWADNSADEDQFEIQRSTSGAGGPFTALATVAANTTTYDDNTVSAGAEYCYQVRAVNVGGASSWADAACATTPSPLVPAAPTALAASTPTHSLVWLTWTDNATNETGYEVLRSTTGSGGPFTLAATLAANAASWADTSRTPSTGYCYEVQAVNADGHSPVAGPVCVTTPAFTGTALDFVGRSATINGYAVLGDLPALHLPAFTLEAWIRRDSTGVGNTTGSGGVDSAVPILAKGIAETETAAADINFFLGIQVSTGYLCADFEEAQNGAAPGQNHPVIGTTAIPADSTWHHVAATYDGNEWRLYLDGALNGQLTVGQPCNTANTCSAALGSALKTDGSPLGFFSGRIDEARVWNSARTQVEIQSTINSQLTSPATGLVARWGMDEGSGTVVGETVGGVGGTLRNTFVSWQSGAPFDWVLVTAPADPTNLAVNACSQSHVDVTWTDAATDETGYQVERSTSGTGGPFTLVATLAANTASWSDLTVSPATNYCYRVRAVRGATSSGVAGPLCVTTPVVGSNALDLGGTNAWVNFGNPAALNLSQFTIEMWIRRDGVGTGTNTGTGGIADAVPLLAKGRAEAETQAADINYLFGIQQSTGRLCADFEEAQSGASPSLNHPIVGATTIALGTWHHVAVTYDGNNWKLFLDGVLDASQDVGQPANNANTVSVSLGTALTTAAAAAGFFDGAIDEVRVWNVARDQSQIMLTANAQITTPQAGLVARWSMDEGSGASVGGSAGTAITGTLTGTYTWGCGTDAAPFGLAFNSPPQAPVLVAPADGATGITTSPSLDVAVTDPEGDAVTVTYYGRVNEGTAGPDFTLIGLPDTQYYTGQLNGGTNAMFRSQTQWILDNLAPRNIVYTVQLGDCVEHGNNGNDPIEWVRADTALKVLEDPLLTSLADGTPYGVCAGNHDQTPIGIDIPDTTTRFYNQYFGVSRFTGRGYYGGHYGTNNDNWYELFSASGMDFIVVSFEYDTSPDPAVLSWADGLLTTYASRRAIVASHFICNTGNPGGFGPQGQAIYDALKGHPNLFLMLCGHVPGEGRRQDTYAGNTVHTLLSDYQSRTNGGNGWMRIMEFSPANNVIRVRTYSPWLNQYEADADSSSQFTLPYVMTSTPAFQAIGSVTVPSGTTASLAWPALQAGKTYEWYAELTDGVGTRIGPVWSFTTGAQVSYTITASAGAGGSISPSGDVTVSAGADQAFTITPDACEHVADVLVDGVSVGAVTSYTFTNVQAAHTIAASFAANAGSPAPVTNLVAERVNTGNDGDGTTQVKLTWTAPTDGSTVTIYRAGYGNYPLYQEGASPGSDPTAGLVLPLTSRWQATAVTASGESDEVTGRDFWYYVAVSGDGCGHFTLSSPTGGVSNYHYGDVADGFTPCQGDNRVSLPDLSALGGSYGLHLPPGDARECLDVGPTTGDPLNGRPLPDGVLDFEDLVLYAANWNPSAGAPAASARFTALRSAVDAIGITAGTPGGIGTTFEVTLELEGSGRVQAVSAPVTWDPSVVELAGVTRGALLDLQSAPAQLLTPGGGVVDVAMLGHGATFEGTGDIARLTFRVLASGDPSIHLGEPRGRDGSNRPVTLEAIAGTPSRPAPNRLEFAPAFPNPFTGSTSFVIGMPAAGHVRMTVYDLLGRAVRHLVDADSPAGWIRTSWDGRDDDGRRLAQGSYIVRLATPGRQVSRTVHMIR